MNISDVKVRSSFAHICTHARACTHLRARARSQHIFTPCDACAQSPVVITITGAAGQIAYSLIPPLASGSVFGMDQPVIFHLLDIPPAQPILAGVLMEIEDLAYPLVAGVVTTDDPAVGFKGCDYAIFLGVSSPHASSSALLARSGRAAQRWECWCWCWCCH